MNFRQVNVKKISISVLHHIFAMLTPYLYQANRVAFHGFVCRIVWKVFPERDDITEGIESLFNASISFGGHALDIKCEIGLSPKQIQLLFIFLKFELLF